MYSEYKNVKFFISISFSNSSSKTLKWTFDGFKDQWKVYRRLPMLSNKCTKHGSRETCSLIQFKDQECCSKCRKCKKVLLFLTWKLFLPFSIHFISIPFYVMSCLVVQILVTFQVQTLSTLKTLKGRDNWNDRWTPCPDPVVDVDVQVWNLEDEKLFLTSGKKGIKYHKFQMNSDKYNTFRRYIW